MDEIRTEPQTATSSKAKAFKVTRPSGRRFPGPTLGASFAQMRKRGVVTVPQEIRDRLDLHEGDTVIFQETDEGVLIKAGAIIPRDQEWFWTPEWQAGEAEADADIAAGRTTFYASDEEFLASLDPESAKK